MVGDWAARPYVQQPILARGLSGRSHGQDNQVEGQSRQDLGSQMSGSTIDSCDGRYRSRQMTGEGTMVVQGLASTTCDIRWSILIKADDRQGYNGGSEYKAV